jgi:alpha-1,3-rhamnosyl/mannosyltransferase
MALGCPVVTSSTSSLPEVGGDAAWYVDPASHESMVEGVARLADTTRDVLHTAALVTQADRFSWDRTAALHEDVYRELDA